MLGINRPPKRMFFPAYPNRFSCQYTLRSFSNLHQRIPRCLPARRSLPPTATATATFTPTATLHPLTIESMRQRSYPGSALTIEQELTAAANFTRSIVSYQSDGLRVLRAAERTRWRSAARRLARDYF